MAKLKSKRVVQARETSKETKQKRRTQKFKSELIYKEFVRRKKRKMIPKPIFNDETQGRHESGFNKGLLISGNWRGEERERRQAVQAMQTLLSGKPKNEEETENGPSLKALSLRGFFKENKGELESIRPFAMNSNNGRAPMSSSMIIEGGRNEETLKGMGGSLEEKSRDCSWKAEEEIGKSSMSRSLSLFNQKNHTNTGFSQISGGFSLSNSLKGSSIFSSNPGQSFRSESLFPRLVNSKSQSAMIDISNFLEKRKSEGKRLTKQEFLRKMDKNMDEVEGSTGESSLVSTQSPEKNKNKENQNEPRLEFPSSQKKTKGINSLFGGVCLKKSGSILEIDLKKEKSFLEKEHPTLKRNRQIAGLFDSGYDLNQKIKRDIESFRAFEVQEPQKEEEEAKEIELRIGSKKTKKFRCFKDVEAVQIPENLKKLEKPLKNDDDIESDDDLIEKGIVSSYKQLLQGLMNEKGEEKAPEIYENYSEPIWIKRWG